MYRLKILDSDFEELERLVFAAFPREACAFVLAGISKFCGGADILVRRPVGIPESLFVVQRQERLEVAAKAVNGIAALCEANGLGAVVCHSHPSTIPYSLSDDHGEKRLFAALGQFLPPKAPLASLLVFPDGLRGRVWEPGKQRFAPLAEVVVIGRSLTRILCHGSTGEFNQPLEAIFDRQARAFGDEGQRYISGTRAGIVGVGGTGSAVAEQLARLGVGDFVLVDPDTLSPSNLARMYGTIGPTRKRWWPWRSSGKTRLKVDLVASHLGRIRPGVRVSTVAESVVVRSAAHMLLDRDVIFLCTDDHWGRSVVNEIAYQYLIPTINLGMSIRARDGTITTAAGGVDVLRPGKPCLWCSQFLNTERIATESMPLTERRSRRRDGYVQDIDTPAPSVISMTTTLAGLAVTQFLQLVTDFMGEPGDVCRLRYDIMRGEVRRGQCNVKRDCICGKVKGFGDLRPLSTLRFLPGGGSEEVGGDRR
jgi:molybdopterin/thiamine biosynthesis adenylyltransferase